MRVEISHTRKFSRVKTSGLGPLICTHKAVVGKAKAAKLSLLETADCTSSESVWLIAGIFIIQAHMGLGLHVSCLERSTNGSTVPLETTETPKV